mmetsp:Transcript_16716/g.37863  ORF Transcript_16716/g.37863 Transcript_16716/m.37863 type:complete len:259 (+) Transcript_16716:530-1306(+)
MHADGATLPQAVGSVRGLRLLRRVVTTVEVHDMTSLRQVEPNTSRCHSEEEHLATRLLCEALLHGRALLEAEIAGERQRLHALRCIARLDELLEELQHRLPHHEDDGLLPRGHNLVQELHESGGLSACLRLPRHREALASLRVLLGVQAEGVATDATRLLHHREDVAAALEGMVARSAPRVPHRSLPFLLHGSVEALLCLRESHCALELNLLREVGQDVSVSLQAPKLKWLCETLQQSKLLDALPWIVLLLDGLRKIF